MFWLIKQLLHVRSIFKSGDTPRQLAFGVGLGVLLGLVMSGNLLAIGLTILVCATRANLSMVALTTLCVGFVAHFADPVTHEIGYFVLTLPAMQSTFQQLYSVPLVPWTNFNHTVVMGSFILGAVLVYPTYRATLPLFRRWKRKDASGTTPEASDETADREGESTDSTTKQADQQDDSAAPLTTPASNADGSDVADEDRSSVTSPTAEILPDPPSLDDHSVDQTEASQTETERVEEPAQAAALPECEPAVMESCTDEQAGELQTADEPGRQSIEQAGVEVGRTRSATDATDDSLCHVEVADESEKTDVPSVEDADGFADRTPTPETTADADVESGETPRVVPAADINAFREVPKSNYGFNASVDS